MALSQQGDTGIQTLFDEIAVGTPIVAKTAEDYLKQFNVSQSDLPLLLNELS